MQTSEQLAAELYDISVPDWDEEIDFYRELAHEAGARNQSVLEVACGTGRVTLRLARDGMDIVGADLDEEMLRVARRKSEDVPNVRWARGDMRTLELGETFGLIICVFPFEMEHLLARTEFEERVVYGDFFKSPLSENSSEMIWLARNKPR